MLPRTIGTNYCCCVHVGRALEREDLDGFLEEGGRDLSDREIREELIAHEGKGFEYFTGCDRPNHEGRCSGHQYVDISGLKIEVTLPTQSVGGTV